MDFSNIDEVMDNMRSYLDSHSLKDNDLMSCDEYVLGEGSNGKIDRLIELDKHGEYLGRYWNAISTDRDLRSNSKITFYVRKDGRLGGVCLVPGKREPGPADHPRGLFPGRGPLLQPACRLFRRRGAV